MYHRLCERQVCFGLSVFACQRLLFVANHISRVSRMSTTAMSASPFYVVPSQSQSQSPHDFKSPMTAASLTATSPIQPIPPIPSPIASPAVSPITTTTLSRSTSKTANKLQSEFTIQFSLPPIDETVTTLSAKQLSANEAKLYRKESDRDESPYSFTVFAKEPIPSMIYLFNICGDWAEIV